MLNGFHQEQQPRIFFKKITGFLQIPEDARIGQKHDSFLFKILVKHSLLAQTSPQIALVPPTDHQLQKHIILTNVEKMTHCPLLSLWIVHGLPMDNL